MDVTGRLLHRMGGVMAGVETPAGHQLRAERGQAKQHRFRCPVQHLLSSLVARQGSGMDQVGPCKWTRDGVSVAERPGAKRRGPVPTERRSRRKRRRGGGTSIRKESARALVLPPLHTCT